MDDPVPPHDISFGINTVEALFLMVIIVYRIGLMLHAQAVRAVS
jgi:hypothetical protein